MIVNVVITETKAAVEQDDAHDVLAVAPARRAQRDRSGVSWAPPLHAESGVELLLGVGELFGR